MDSWAWLRTDRQTDRRTWAKIDSASDPDQEYTYFIDSASDPDQEYIDFMGSETLHSACYILMTYGRNIPITAKMNEKHRKQPSEFSYP